MNTQYIEDKAFQLQKEIWENRHLIWRFGSASPIEMLNPEVACQILGFEYEEYEDLGNFGNKGARFKVAGMIDRNSKRVVVAKDKHLEKVRFTAAHEIGHLMLHPDIVMHRDRPMKDNWHADKYTRPEKEKDADYFAACFLMPKKYLENQFRKRFLYVPFHFDDQTSYLLNPQDSETLLRSEPGSNDRALALAKCESFNGQRFHSLAKQFKVSITAMAIRLEELGFIKWP